MGERRMNYENYMKKVWFIETIPLGVVNNNTRTCLSQGGGLCIDPSGLILTAAQVVCPPNFNQQDYFIRARACNDVGFTRSVELVAKFPQFDLALLKVSKVEDELLDFCHIAEGVQLEEGIRVFGFVHPCSSLYSFLSGSISFPFPQETVLLPDMTDETTMASSGLLLKRRPTFFKEYRTVSLLAERSNVEFHHLHPYLPLLQVGGFTINNGSAGCPLFRKGSGELLGLCTIQKEDFQFAIPVNFLRKFVDHIRNLYDC